MIKKGRKRKRKEERRRERSKTKRKGKKKERKVGSGHAEKGNIMSSVRKREYEGRDA